MGLNQGAGTLMGRAYGYKSQVLLMNYFNKGLLVYIISFLIFAAVSFNAEVLMVFLGQNS